MGSHAMYLKIVNNTNFDITKITVSEILNSDWDGFSRPDRNFQDVSIKSLNAHEEREELNSAAQSAYYTLHLAFSNGQRIDLRNDQYDAQGTSNRIYGLSGPQASSFTASQVAGDAHNTFSIYESVPTQTWMQGLADSKRLTELTLPGTHDSCAQIGGHGNFAKCQGLNLIEQFHRGVRFIDIRCRHYKNAFTIHHGIIYQQLNFNDVITICQKFLQNYPSECIVMSVKEEHDPNHNTQSFEQTFQNYVHNSPPNLWYLQDKIPQLGNVRGKIVLLRRFSAKPPSFGINVNQWDDNATFSHTNANGITYSVQDLYKVDTAGNHKLQQIKDQMIAAQNGPADTLYLNFTSGTNIPWDTPKGFSNNINPRLNHYLVDTPSRKRAGIFALDFCEEPDCLIPQIISYNTWG